MTTSPEPTPDQLAALRRRIGVERLSGYDRATGDPQRAVALYRWNATVSAAVFEDLGTLEVVLRNACHEQLQRWNAAQGRQDPWYQHPVLQPRHRQDVAVARNRVARGRKPETEGRVIAELMWGFWRLLHSKTYEVTLWRPCLRLAYPLRATLTRGQVYDRLDHLNTLRNRIAHHEPVHGRGIAQTGRDLAGLHTELLELLSWIDTDVHDLVHHTSRVPALLAARP